MSGPQQMLLAGRVAGGDPHFANVAFLLHGNGTNGGSTFTDSSSHARTVIASGGATTSTAQSKFNGSSLSFTGAGSGLKYSDSADFTLGAGDFTFECFARFDDTGTLRFLAGQSDVSGTPTTISFAISRTVGNKLHFLALSGASAVVDFDGTTTLSANTWYYIAATREGSTFTLWLDAVSEGTASSGATLNNSGDQMGVGILGNESVFQMDGFMAEIRLTVGVARNIAGIGVPTAAFPNS